jgi:hypothetical protein
MRQRKVMMVSLAYQGRALSQKSKKIPRNFAPFLTARVCLPISAHGKAF